MTDEPELKINLCEMEPTLIEASDGTWLAVAGPQAPVRVGAWGDTKEQAKVAFRAALLRLDGALNNVPYNETNP